MKTGVKDCSVSYKQQIAQYARVGIRSGGNKIWLNPKLREIEMRAILGAKFAFSFLSLLYEYLRKDIDSRAIYNT